MSSTAVTLPQILQLAPNARSSYRQAFQMGQPAFDAFGISANALRVAHFMAQVLYECAALTLQFENLNYSAQRLSVVFAKYFQPKGALDPAQYANNPQRLANTVYAGRMGNDAPTDGYTYRGRGLLQLTGKQGYRDVTQSLRARFPGAPDFVAQPDAVISAAWCIPVAADYWSRAGCNALADQDALNAVTRRINGGLNGLSGRADWLLRTKHVWH